LPAGQLPAGIHMFSMKKIFGMAGILCLALISEAQVTRASLQASGLTCAMCARSVFKNLESLPFIQKIDTDLETSTFLLEFKPEGDVDADQIRKKVEDAGFSVAALKLNMKFDGQTISNDQHLSMNGKVYHFLNVKDQVLSGEKTLLLVDKSFLTAKEQKKFSGATRMECYRTGTAGDCCSKDGIAANTRIYHVSM
jgi:copper chaperone CopZ